MMGDFDDLYSSLGVLGLLIAFALNTVVNACVMWVVVNHLMSNAGGSFVQCLQCAFYLAVVVVVAALAAAFIPLVGALVALFILYKGSVAVVEGTFELTRGALVVVVLYVIVGAGVSLGVNQIMGDGSSASYASYGSSYYDEGSSGDSGDEAVVESESETEEPAQRRIARFQEEEFKVRQVFRATGLEKDTIPQFTEYPKGKIILGLSVETIYPMNHFDGQLLYHDPRNEAQFDTILADWPVRGARYYDYTPYRVAPAREDGSLPERGEVAGLLTASVKYYYLFFILEPPSVASKWYFAYSKDESETYTQVTELGDISSHFGE